MSNITKIKISGTSYNIKDENASNVVELTQAEYDALPATAKTSNSLFVITDAEAGDLTNYYTKSQTNTLLGGKQDTLVSGTNIKTINNTSILGSGNIDIQGGGGKAVNGGTNISITTGETADTINCTLPISAVSSNIIIKNASNGISPSNNFSQAFGSGNTIDAYGGYNHNCITVEGIGNSCGTQATHVEGGYNTSIYGSYSHVEGAHNKLEVSATLAEVCSHVEGKYNKVLNYSEHASGQYNISNKANTTWGDSGNTLFSVGNGTADNARHNAFEIRQNGDIYISSGGTDIKLQDNLGGGGGGSDINVVQTTGSSTTDVMSQDAVTTQLNGYVTTTTDQNIRGIKTFVGEKRIKFKQELRNNKLGFTMQNTSLSNNELATFELRPNTFTIDGVQHPLLYLGHYRNTSVANAGVPQTVIGFRQYDETNAAAYHYLMPLPDKAKTPFSLTTSFKDYYAPLGFKNGSTMVTADDTGVVDLSSVLGGLKLVKLTQAEYDALTTKDDNTVYFIGDATNGYTMKIGSANVN